MKNTIITIIGIVLGAALYIGCLMFIYWGDISVIGSLTKGDRIEILIWGVCFVLCSTLATHAASDIGD